MKLDMLKQKERENRMKSMDSGDGGREAETVYRDARGMIHNNNNSEPGVCHSAHKSLSFLYFSFR